MLEEHEKEPGEHSGYDENTRMFPHRYDVNRIIEQLDHRTYILLALTHDSESQRMINR